MNIKNIVLTTVGLVAIYKTGKLAGFADATTAIHKELQANHGLGVKRITIIWPKRNYEVKIVKIEEEAE